MYVCRPIKLVPPFPSTMAQEGKARRTHARARHNIRGTTKSHILYVCTHTRYDDLEASTVEESATTDLMRTGMAGVLRTTTTTMTAFD